MGIIYYFPFADMDGEALLEWVGSTAVSLSGC
jgi:hypothetical protein